MLSSEAIKQKLGTYAAGLVPRESVIGLGTGTTVLWLITALAERIKQGLEIKAVPTSSATKKLAAEAGIKIVSLNDTNTIPMTIDGADEIDPGFQLIKGGGGALLQEKLVAAASDKLVIIAEHSKWVGQLGKFPLPVEVIPVGWKQVQKKILSLGCQKAELRLVNNLPCVTDNGHYILDCHFLKIGEAQQLDTDLHLIPGVVETGLFIKMAHTVILGHPDGKLEVKNRLS